MATLQNRAQLRDTIRRSYLGITPPIDTGTGPVGAVPPNQPDPSNPVLNACIEQAGSEINRKVGFTANTQVVIPVYAISTSWLGPQYFDLSQCYFGAINELRRVVWDDGTGNPQLLTPTTYQEQDRQMLELDNQPSGVPLYYYVEAYKMFIFPASTANGNLNIYAGTSPMSPSSDSDYIQQLPADYQDVWCIIAACKYLESRMSNQEAMAMLQALEPRRMDGIKDIADWKSSLNTRQESGLGVTTYRQSAGLRRTWR